MSQHFLRVGKPRTVQLSAPTLIGTHALFIQKIFIKHCRWVYPSLTPTIQFDDGLRHFLSI